MGHKKSTPVKEPASLKASPNLGGMQLMVSKSTVMDRPAMEQKNPHQHCQSDPTEILQGISKSSMTWRNTVMNLGTISNSPAMASLSQPKANASLMR